LFVKKIHLLNAFISSLFLNLLHIGIMTSRLHAKSILLVFLSTSVRISTGQFHYLHQVILESFIPKSSDKCKYVSNSTNGFNHSFTHSKSESDWHSMSENYEDDLFQAEMGHIDTNSNRTWTLRVGRGGNIYSLRGAYSESVPPQGYAYAPYVDEVWQSVAVNDRNPGKNTKENPYFVHQSGVYQKSPADRVPPTLPEPDLVDDPFYSPSIASFCSNEQKSCYFGSWGQQAHVPTIHTSDVLYFNKYTDCGNGVMELISVVYNAADSTGVELNYVNIPWGGVRTSTFADIALSYKNGTSDYRFSPYPIQGWGQVGEHKPNIVDTAGYTSFVQDLPFPDDTKVDKSFDIILASTGTLFKKNNYHSTKNNKQYISIKIEYDEIIASGCSFCSLTFINARTSDSFLVTHVQHWAWNTDLLLVESEANIKDLNKLWKGNDEILVEFTGGMREDDNLALTFVHGNRDQCLWSPACKAKIKRQTRLRYGLSGNALRKYMPFTINSFTPIKPGDALTARQYMISGSYTASNILPRQWVDEAKYDLIEKKKSVDDDGSAGTDIQLYISVDGSAFDFAIGNQTCMGGNPWCKGSSTPKFGTKAFFNIKCGTSSYVGSDLYVFASEDEGGVIRSYDTCNDGKRAEWQLLGFFDESCSPLFRFVKYDSLFCTGDISNLPSELPSASMFPSTTPTVLPSTVPSDLSSTVPSDLPSTVPSDLPSTVASKLPSASMPPSTTPTVLPSTVPSDFPSTVPSVLPSTVPSDLPSTGPSELPSASMSPSTTPTVLPSTVPSDFPSTVPSVLPSMVPSELPSTGPSELPSSSVSPSKTPTVVPSTVPSAFPSTVPSVLPSTVPSVPISCYALSKKDCRKKKNRDECIYLGEKFYTCAALFPIHVNICLKKRSQLRCTKHAFCEYDAEAEICENKCSAYTKLNGKKNMKCKERVNGRKICRFSSMTNVSRCQPRR